MKNLIMFFLFLSVLLFQRDVSAGDRNILVERFTSSTCGPCASANPSMEAFLGSSDPNKVTGLSYHMNWPAPGNDPMYLANPNDNTTRRTYYGVNSIPYWFFDGTYTGGTSLGLLQSLFATRTNVLSPVSIVVRETRNGNNVNVTAEIYCEYAVNQPTAYVHFAIVEKLVQYASPPGTNGESSFHDVMRKMLPNGNGIPITLLPGEKTVLNYSYTIDPAWQAANIQSLVFVQGYANEVYNCAKPTLNYNLISTPSYKVVNQGQSQSADYKIKIPVTASGYNSTVTFTAALETPVSGISVSFPGGNTISNFPDSLSLNVTSTSSVPSGAYKIIVTGTNTNGVVHKTILNYLVGKNYALFGVSRTQGNIRVDGISYNSAQLFTWDIGSSHNFEAVSPISVGNTKYVFVNWSGGGPISQTVTVGTQPLNYIAFYKTQYRMISSVSPSGLPSTVNGGNEYHDSASSLTLGVSANPVQFNGKTYYFQSWSGTGVGSYTGPNLNQVINVNNVLVENAVFDTINVGITNYNSSVPDKFSLHQNYPNPFNPLTNIKFDIAKSTFVSLKVYNALGKEVSNPVSENLSAGSYLFSLDASAFASGIYYYSLKTNEFSDIKKMILIK